MLDGDGSVIDVEKKEHAQEKKEQAQEKNNEQEKKQNLAHAR